MKLTKIRLPGQALILSMELLGACNGMGLSSKPQATKQSPPDTKPITSDPVTQPSPQSDIPSVPGYYLFCVDDKQTEPTLAKVRCGIQNGDHQTQILYSSKWSITVPPASEGVTATKIDEGPKALDGYFEIRGPTSDAVIKASRESVVSSAFQTDEKSPVIEKKYSIEQARSFAPIDPSKPGTNPGAL